MKKILKKVLIVAVLLTIVYSFAMLYSSRIEKIENGELTLVSESYRD